MTLEEKVFASMGLTKADLVLENCRIVNVNTREITEGSIAITSGFISGIGDVDELAGEKTRKIDVKNAHVSPGLIDGHVHFESSMLTLTQFARQSLIHGTTGMIIDPHEIANVLGTKGIRLVMKEASFLPVDIFFTIPSCVPSTPLETSGAKLGVAEIKKLIVSKQVVGLGEVMDYPEVLRGNPDILGKIAAAFKMKLVVDGHAPGLRGRELAGYIACGISSDHESITFEEILEKARLGMKIMLREGSAAKSLHDFIPKLLESGISLENFFFATDDKHPADIIKGHMDAHVRQAISLGIEPVQAISMATLNTARHFRIDHLIGSISIGKKANLVILDDMQDFRIRCVVTNGEINPGIKDIKYPKYVLETVKYKKILPDDLKIHSGKRIVRANVIGIVPEQLITERRVEELVTERTFVHPDIEHGILPIAVIERHGKTGNIGKGFVSGFNLENGAFGQSIGHDSHNIIVIGTNFEDMAFCANRIKKLHGGIVIANGTIVEEMPLPFAGILSTTGAHETDMKLGNLHAAIKNMGCKLDAPFIQASFLTLPVIPSLKITDCGMVDVDAFKIIKPLEET
ncbi:MAG: adenine deaminase [Candidatus Methanoperedens sp.]|nr:adenine deaminase [Candidatus Methanoperedens sp.]